LRLSNDQRKRLAIYRDHIGTTEGAGELGYRRGADMARGILLLRAAMLDMPLMPDTFAAIDHGAAATFPVKAADLIETFPGRFHGRALGDALRRLEALWIASDFTADRNTLLAAS
jgi:poly(A) polymerase